MMKLNTAAFKSSPVERKKNLNYLILSEKKVKKGCLVIGFLDCWIVQQQVSE